VLYEAITLAHPFEGESYQQLISNIVLHAHKPLRERVAAAPREVEAFIDRALRKEPGDRYPSAAAMLTEARRLLAALPSDEALGFRHDEPTAVMRAAPNEPTQVIEVSPSAAASAAARPQRPPRQAPPAHPPAPPPRHPQSLPPPAWGDAPESATLVDAPAHRPAVTVGNDERSVSRNAITVVAVIAGVLVFGALAVRIRSVALLQAPDVQTAPTTQTAPAPAPVAQVLAAPAAQVLAAPAAQVLAAQPAAPVAQPAAQVLAPPAAPRLPAPTPRAVERPAPRRVVAPAPPAGSTDARMPVLRLALPSLRACAAQPPRYVGNVSATVFFDVRGRVRETQLQAPSPVTVHGACIRRALGQLVVPTAANSAVPMFYTFN
jgi:serine/threonine-protein kinase